MATQRLTVATIGGDAGSAVEALFQSWRVEPTERTRAEVDLFCERLRENSITLPIIYYCEWMDRWLMGEVVPGPNAVQSRRYQVSCMSPETVIAWVDQCGDQFIEQQWLAARLREAAVAWEALVEFRVVVVTREVLDVSNLDEEVVASLRGVPEWLLIKVQGE